MKTYPIEETQGVVFVFVGDIEPPPLIDDLQPKLLAEGLTIHPLMRHKIDCDWRLGAENGFDPGHIYAHRYAELFRRFGVRIPLAGYPWKKSGIVTWEGPGPKGVAARGSQIMVWVAEVEGVRVRSPGVDPENQPTETEPLQSVSVYLPCGLQVENFPLPGMIHFEWYVPMDEDHHMYLSAEGKYVNSDQEAKEFHDMFEEQIAPLVWQPPREQSDPVGNGPTWGFNNFDAYARAQMQHVYSKEDWWRRERLFRPDHFIVEWRRLVAKHARGIQRRGNWGSSRRMDADG